jgi:hypothetical protein
MRQKDTTSPPPLASRRHDVRLTRVAPHSPHASRLGCLSVYAVIKSMQACVVRMGCDGMIALARAYSLGRLNVYPHHLHHNCKHLTTHARVLTACRVLAEGITQVEQMHLEHVNRMRVLQDRRLAAHKLLEESTRQFAAGRVSVNPFHASACLLVTRLFPPSLV